MKLVCVKHAPLCHKFSRHIAKIQGQRPKIERFTTTWFDEKFFDLQFVSRTLNFEHRINEISSCKIVQFIILLKTPCKTTLGDLKCTIHIIRLKEWPDALRPEAGLTLSRSLMTMRCHSILRAAAADFLFD